MAQQFEKLNQEHIDFINNQHIFFVATSSEDSFVNLSPKEIGALRIINNQTALWLNLTGSGNESSYHVQKNGKMTLMFCSFDKTPLILKLYANTKVFHENDKKYEELYSNFDDFVGARQLFLLDIKQIVTSCGYGVPYYEYKKDRDTLDKWAKSKGRDGIKQYWSDKNTTNVNGYKIDF